MYRAIENRRSAHHFPLVRLVARRPVAAFLVMVYAVAWTVFLPVVLQAWGLLALPIDLTGGSAFEIVVSVATILGVALPAFVVMAARTACATCSAGA